MLIAAPGSRLARFLRHTTFVATALSAAAETWAEEKQSLQLGYAFSTILGTGYYDVGDSTLLVLRLPFSWQNEAMHDAEVPWRVLLPVTTGLTRVNGLLAPDEESSPPTGTVPTPTPAKSGVFGGVVSEEVQALTFAPGIEWTFRTDSEWELKPYFQLGIARDTGVGETAYLAFLGVNGRRSWAFGEGKLTWGNGVVGAFQQIEGTGHRSGLGLLQTGVDYEFERLFRIGGSSVTPSVFVLWQHFANDLDIADVEAEEVNVNNLYSFGTTIGFRKEKEFLGIPYQRIGLTFIRGEDLKAISVNLGFPL